MPKAAVEVKEKVKKEKEPKEPKGIGVRKEATLIAMRGLGGKKLTHKKISIKTGKDKGNQLRDLTALGLVETVEGEDEGRKVHLFSLTAEGRKVASKLK